MLTPSDPTLDRGVCGLGSSAAEGGWTGLGGDAGADVTHVKQRGM